jgi:hypothetical protein
MSGMVNWIAAEDADSQKDNFASSEREAGHGADQERQGNWSGASGAADRSLGKFSSQEQPWQELPVHNFPAQINPAQDAELGETALDRNPDVWLYRKRTMALLRRYMRYSVETGRLPSIVGREMFRSRISHYTVTTFEDRVIFVRDVERCLEQLDKFDQQIIARVVLEEHGHDRAAALLGCARRTIERRLPEVLDMLSEAFLAAGLLLPGPERPPEAEKR